MLSQHKYARVEWERRFLLARLPENLRVTQTRRIVDRYIDGTRLRLRQISDLGGNDVFKLTQKLPSDPPGVQQGLITTLYLVREEFEVLSKIPAKTLSKIRHSVPPFGIDVFQGSLYGLVLAEAEFQSDEEAACLVLPSFVAAEVTADARFSGGNLAAGKRDDVRAWLADYSIELDPQPA